MEKLARDDWSLVQAKPGMMRLKRTPKSKSKKASQKINQTTVASQEIEVSSGMRTFSVPVKLLPQNIDVVALVDTGATFSKVPAHLLRKPKVKVDFKRGVELGDGRIVERKVGYVRLMLHGKKGLFPVRFGSKGERPLVGATTLDILGLMVDPTKQILVECPSLEVTSLLIR